MLFIEGQQPDRITHIFACEVSSDVVSQDLQTFYEKGEEDLQVYIKCVVLNTSGTSPQKKKKDPGEISEPFQPRRRLCRNNFTSSRVKKSNFVFKKTSRSLKG